MGKTLSERFWSKVDVRGENECWIWQGSIFKDTGYGQIYFEGGPTTAHRVSYFLHNGTLPVRPLEVCHTCDNRPCVNPKHLFAGTRKDNMQDAKSKGRLSTGQQHADACVDTLAKGEKNGQHKLTEDDVLEILQLALEGKSQRTIGRMFNVNHKTIHKITSGETWKHITA